MDNGIGLLVDCVCFFELYVIIRDKGIGLGFFIVKKIIEEYGGMLVLFDVFVFVGNEYFGVMVEIILFVL